MFFLLTTAVGSALWVIKLEEQKAIVAGQGIVPPTFDEDDDDPDALANPMYTDDPL